MATITTGPYTHAWAAPNFFTPLPFTVDAPMGVVWVAAIVFNISFSFLQINANGNSKWVASGSADFLNLGSTSQSINVIPQDDYVQENVATGDETARLRQSIYVTWLDANANFDAGAYPSSFSILPAINI